MRFNTKTIWTLYLPAAHTNFRFMPNETSTPLASLVHRRVHIIEFFRRLLPATAILPDGLSAAIQCDVMV